MFATGGHIIHFLVTTMTDEDSLVKSGFEAVMKPISDLIEKIAGPAAEELGLTLQDSVRVYRAKRQLRLLQKTQEMLDGFKAQPQRVPLKALLPIIQHGSNEEDDGLQDRWAALLANIAVRGLTIPAAPDILRQLTPYDVLLLQMCYDTIEALKFHGPGPMPIESTPQDTTIEKWKIALREHGIDAGRYGDCDVWDLTIDNLVRLGLLLQRTQTKAPDYWSLTKLGYNFILLCQLSA
jgi:hypothetical protein